jgi:hypothetical protein
LPDSRSGSIRFCCSGRYSWSQAPHDEEFAQNSLQRLPVKRYQSISVLPQDWGKNGTGRIQPTFAESKFAKQFRFNEGWLYTRATPGRETNKPVSM